MYADATAFQVPVILPQSTLKARRRWSGECRSCNEQRGVATSWMVLKIRETSHIRCKFDLIWNQWADNDPYSFVFAHAQHRNKIQQMSFDSSNFLQELIRNFTYANLVASDGCCADGPVPKSADVAMCSKSKSMLTYHLSSATNPKDTYVTTL